MVRFASRFTSQGEGGYAGIRSLNNRRKILQCFTKYLQPSIFVLTKYLDQ